MVRRAHSCPRTTASIPTASNILLCWIAVSLQVVYSRGACLVNGGKSAVGLSTRGRGYCFHQVLFAYSRAAPVANPVRRQQGIRMSKAPERIQIAVDNISRVDTMDIAAAVVKE